MDLVEYKKLSDDERLTMAIGQLAAVATFVDPIFSFSAPSVPDGSNLVVTEGSVTSAAGDGGTFYPLDNQLDFLVGKIDLAIDQGGEIKLTSKDISELSMTTEHNVIHGQVVAESHTERVPAKSTDQEKTSDSRRLGQMTQALELLSRQIEKIQKTLMN